MRRGIGIATAVALILRAAWALAGQSEPDISNGVPVWPQYYNGTSFRHPRLDASTRAVKTVSYEHSEIHGGKHFHVTNSASVASGATVAYLLATPPGAEQVHLIFSATGSAITDVRLIEEVTGVKGTAATIFNSNRNSSNTSGCTFYHTVTGSPLGSGTTIYRIYSGSAQGASRIPMVSYRDEEIVLKTGVTYCVWFQSGTNDNLTNLQLQWYEHVPKDN